MSKYATRLRRNAKIRFGLAAAIAALALIFLIWPNFKQFAETREQIAALDAESATTNSAIEEKRDEYRILKNEYASSATSDENTAAAILPAVDAKTDIVRALETKANQIADDDSLILESVNIGDASTAKDADYRTLPIKISLTGTKEKLFIFLRYLEKTGAASGETTNTRLIDVQDVSLQMKDRGTTSTSTDTEVNMEISANAYFLPSENTSAAE